MALIDGARRAIGIAAFLGAALSLGGCNSVDLDVDAPILEAAGISLTSKKKDDEDLPERPGIVIPPSTEKLPEPGTHTAAAGPQAWPADPDRIKKQKAEEAAAAREKYCAEGDWSEKANISEFDKNIGKEARCPSKLGEVISKQVGGAKQQ